MKQASELQEKDHVSYSQLPSFMVADITARLSTLPQLSLPTKHYTLVSRSSINTQLSYHQSFSGEYIWWWISYLLSLKYLIKILYVRLNMLHRSGTCYTGPVTRHDLLLSLVNNEFVWKNVFMIILPSTKSNKSTLDALDATFYSLDQNVGEDITKLNSDVNLIQETYVTSINDVFTYVAFGLNLVNSFALLSAICRSRCYQFSSVARHRLNGVVSESVDIPFENFPACEDCSRPRCPSTWATAVFVVEWSRSITTWSLLFCRQSQCRRYAGPFRAT